MNKKIVEKTLIEKGWSNDKKYCVTDEKGKKYHLWKSLKVKKQNLKT